MPDLTGRSYSSDTALTQVDEGVYEATIAPNWLVARGAHGGFLAGVTVAAMLAEAGDDRPIRSFTMHFMRPPTTGRIRIEPVVERSGRSAVFLSARATQNDKAIGTALAALSSSFADFPFDAAAPPSVPCPHEVEPAPPGIGPPFLDNFDLRWCVGDHMFSGSEKALVGGWFRADPPELADAAMVASFMDTWPPAIFPLLTNEPLIAPTLDFTVHFRERFPLEGAAPEDFYLGAFSSSLSRDGFFEEDGRLWDGRGNLVAQSRQLALLLKPGD